MTRHQFIRPSGAGKSARRANASSADVTARPRTETAEVVPGLSLMGTDAVGCTQILGDAYAQADEYLRQMTPSADNDESPIASRVRQYIYDRDFRSGYVEMALHHLKHKRLEVSSEYDVVLVGAGIHTAMWLYTVKQRIPNLKALVLEQSCSVCATFAALGDSLVLNSPTFAKVGLNSNIAPGHFIQISDFDEVIERPFPTAKHLYELAVLMCFHADADIHFDFDVNSVENVGDRYRVSCEGRAVVARTVIVANGMGGQKNDAFAQDIISDRVCDGDHFIQAYCENDAFYETLRGQSVAVIGAGDTANCVMEHLLPLTYPNRQYAKYHRRKFAPSFVYWIGQSAHDVRQYYQANKQRYCHSGGLIEYFWHGDEPFDLPLDDWNQIRNRVRCIASKLDSVVHQGKALELSVGEERLVVDYIVDCTGRHNALGHQLTQEDYEFVYGDVVLRGGQYDDKNDRFTDSPRHLGRVRLACRLKGERIFLLGCASPLDELVGDDEARDGSLQYQDVRRSLTNSKFSLEHTLPRTVEFAVRWADYVYT